MKKIYRRVIIGVLLAASALAAGWIMQSRRGLKVETAQVLSGPVEDIYTEEGVISWGEDYLVTARVSGSVKELLVQENEMVQKDDVLLVIDSTDYEYEKELAESQLAGYEAQLEQTRISQVMTTSPQEYLDTLKQQMAAGEAQAQAARSVYEADQVLYASGDIARIQLESEQAAYEAAQSARIQAKNRYEESLQFLESLKEEGIDQNTINSRFYNSQVDQLTAQIQASKTGIRQLEDRISDCRVTAKTDGMITSFPAKNLSVVQAGETLAVINGHQTAMAEADVLTTIAPYIRSGDLVEVVLRLRGKDETFQGTVTEVYDYAEKGTSSLGLDEYRVHVKAELADGETLERKDGYGVNITFCLFQSEEALSVPSGAVFESDGEHYVFQIRQGRAYKVPVEITYQTGTRTIIASGLQKEDVVIDQVDSEGIYEGAEVRK